MAADWLPSWRRSSKRRSWSAEIDPVTIPDDVRKSLRPDRGRRGQSRFEDCVSHHPAFRRSCSSSRRSPLQPPLFCRLQKLLSEPISRSDLSSGTEQKQSKMFHPCGCGSCTRFRSPPDLPAIIEKVPYQRINTLGSCQSVSRRYAAAILISPVLLLSKSRRHFVTLGYVDTDGKQQALVFRLEKGDIRAVLAALEARTGRRIEYQDAEARKAGKG